MTGRNDFDVLDKDGHHKDVMASAFDIGRTITGCDDFDVVDRTSTILVEDHLSIRRSFKVS